MTYRQLDDRFAKIEPEKCDSKLWQKDQSLSPQIEDHLRSQQPAPHGSFTITNVRSLNNSPVVSPMESGRSLSPHPTGIMASGYSMEYEKLRISQLEEDLKILKISISNVYHSFCSQPNTKVNQELADSIEKGSIPALVLFLGRLVERLEMYKIQEESLKELRSLLEDTSSMNCTLIGEKEMMKNEIIDIVETCHTYEEVKRQLVGMLNKTGRISKQSNPAKRRRVTITSPSRSPKSKRVRSSQLRSRHPMYEVSSQSRLEPGQSGRESSSWTRLSEQKQREGSGDVIELSSKDGDSDHNSNEQTNKQTNILANGDDQDDNNISDSSKNDLLFDTLRMSGKRKRGQYSHYDRETKLMIGRYASEYGPSKSALHFTGILGHKVSESTVRNIAKQFTKGCFNDEPVGKKMIKEEVIEMTIEEYQTDLFEPDNTADNSQSDVNEEAKLDNENLDEAEDTNDPASADDVLPDWSTTLPEGGRRKRGNYVHYDEAIRAEIGKYAIKHGTAKACRHFTKEIGRNVSESTVRNMRDQYKKLQREGVSDISVLPFSPRGAPTLLGKLDAEVQKWIRNARQQGGLINTRVVMAAADGIVMKHSKHKLKRFGGDITITKHYARSLLKRMGLVKPRHSKEENTLPDDFETMKSKFVSRVKNVVTENLVPDSLIINWNQISCPLVPGGNWTQEQNVDPNMSACSVDDKRLISLTIAITKSGRLLPPQVIYQGRTDRCLPNGVKFPDGWDVIHSESPLGNEQTMIHFLDNIILPYVSTIRGSSPNIAHNQQVIALFDASESNNSQTLYQKLKDNNITSVFVPVCCKEQLQPVNLDINDMFKDMMKEHFSEWYSQEVLTTLLQQGYDEEETAIDMKTTRLKPIHAQWIIKTFADLEKQSDVIQKGFAKAGLSD